jgi:hypothetical protein
MDFWNYGGATPSRQGWYAVLICYDEMEGVFPGGAYWNPTTASWHRKAVIAYGGHECENEDSAVRLAYANDPDAP